MPRYTTAVLANALQEAHGLVYVAAAQLGCRAETIKVRLAQSPEIRRVQDEAKGRLLDQTEQRLYDAIEAGDPWAIQFFLKTQGKSRGYVERQEVAPTDTEGKTLDLATLVLAAKQ
jgi:hypothetical protein